MSPVRKLAAPVTLFAAIEAEQYEALRLIAFQERRSIADLAREAVAELVKSRGTLPKIPARLKAERVEVRAGKRRVAQTR